MDLLHILLAIGATTMGAVLQASTGLGGGLVIVPLLALISLDFVPGPIIFASIVLSFTMLYRERQHLQWFGLWFLMAGVLIGLVAGILSLDRIPLEDAGVFFALLVLAAALVSAAGVHVRFNRISALLAGSLAGFMGTTAGIGAPILAMLYQRNTGPSLRSTLGFVYFVSSIAMLLALHAVGLFGLSELVLGLWLMPAFVLGFFIGRPVARVLDRGYARAAVLTVSIASALALLIKSW